MSAKPQVQVGSLGSDGSHIGLEGPGVHRQRFGLLGIIGLSFAILNSPTAMSASLSVVLTSGGPVSVCWGLVISAISVFCVALSLAEICSVLPTSGGPYHYVFRLASPKSRVPLAYFTGWLACAGWVCLTATTSSLAGSLIVGIIALLHDSYEVQAWHEFLIYIAFAIGAWFINVFGARALDPVNRAALVWSISGVVIICITCLACASPNYGTGKFVFGTYVNETGWNNGVAFILGLLQSTFGLVGVDGASHICDEIVQPHILAPRAMILAPLIGSLSAFIILIVFLFVLTDFDQVTSGSAGPLLEIIYQAVGNRGGAIALYMFPVVSMAFAAISILCASSRQTQSFARDKGLIFGTFWEKESPRWGVPIASITLTSVWVIIFGCIYLGSTSALNAILSSSVVMLQLSYSVPITILLVRGRKLLDEVAAEEDREFQTIEERQQEGIGANVSSTKRNYNLGKFGWIINLWAVLFSLFTSVFFLFPPELPTSGSTANYAAAVVAFVVLLAVVSWVIDGRKQYEGPKDLDLALARARQARIYDERSTSPSTTPTATNAEPATAPAATEKAEQ